MGGEEFSEKGIKMDFGLFFHVKGRGGQKMWTQFSSKVQVVTNIAS